MCRLFLIVLLTLSTPLASAQTTTRTTTAPDDIKINPATEALINDSLKYLASRQLPSGAFESDNHQVAITSYALLAFMSAGNLPDQGPYAKTVNDGFNFLLNCVRADGFIAAPTG